MTDGEPESEEDFEAAFLRMRRFDFVSEIESFDKETGIARSIFHPHPDRYKSFEEDGRTLFLDLVLKEAIPLELLAQSVPGTPIFASERVVDSTEEYGRLRSEAIHSEAKTGQHTPPERLARAAGELRPSNDPRLLGFISVDIVNSTAIRLINRSKFDMAMEFFIKEMGNLAAVFGASVLKITGDGMIFYIDHPSFNVQADTTNDLATSIVAFMRISMRPAMLKMGLPGFDIRVGADLGPASVNALTIPATGFVQVDIASDALNKAVKLEQFAPMNSILIGWHLYRLSHIQWIKRAEKVDYAIAGLEGYDAFQLF